MATSVWVLVRLASCILPLALRISVRAPKEGWNAVVVGVSRGDWRGGCLPGFSLPRAWEDDGRRLVDWWCKFTVGDHVRQTIAIAYETNSMQPLLPGPKGGA